MARCDRCGQTVEAANSAVALEQAALGNVPLWAGERHLYPVGDCPGSPSRVQVIEMDPIWATAYARLQQKAHCGTGAAAPA
jgi:hypothetical protein